MDYWPNVDAVEWFARDIFPSVRRQRPDACFYIVGSRPTPQVQALGKLPGVAVTGSVPDIRPYVAHARISVAPLRIARGIQNKVLEAMAMAKVTVVSPEALEGIGAVPGTHLLLAQGAEEFASTVRNALSELPQQMGANARALVTTQYSWESHLAGVLDLLDTTGSEK
jgi:glycosyltransferase involved in cell wall biosynthesis